MDVYTMYMGSDVYSSIRNPEYRDYEKFPYGTFETNVTAKTNNYYRMAQEKKDQLKKSKAKDNCPFCREQKKRPLGQYLRKRQISNRDEKICEELEECEEMGEEEEEEEEENEQTDAITEEQHKQHHDHKHGDTGGASKQK